jgi:hypothetical protein
VIPFLLAAVPYSFREGDIGRRLSWAVPPLGAYLLSVLWFLDTEIHLPGEFLPWGGALVTVLFALSALAIAARVFLLRRSTYALAFAASVWGVAAAGAIGIAWKSEVIFAYQEKSLPESPLAITLEKHGNENSLSRDHSFSEEFYIRIPFQGNEDGTAWIYTKTKSDKEELRGGDKELDSSAFLPSVFRVLGLQTPMRENNYVAGSVTLGNAKKMRIYLEQFRLVKFAEFPLENDGLYRSANGILFTRNFKNVFNWNVPARNRNSSSAELRSIHINSRGPVFVAYWDPKTRSALNWTNLSLSSAKETSWIGLVSEQVGYISVPSVMYSDSTPVATDLYSGFPIPGSTITIFSMESTGKRAVKTFVRGNEKENWREKQ